MTQYRFYFYYVWFYIWRWLILNDSFPFLLHECSSVVCVAVICTFLFACVPNKCRHCWLCLFILCGSRWHDNIKASLTNDFYECSVHDPNSNEYRHIIVYLTITLPFNEGLLSVVCFGFSFNSNEYTPILMKSIIMKYSTKTAIWILWRVQILAETGNYREQNSQ